MDWLYVQRRPCSVPCCQRYSGIQQPDLSYRRPFGHIDIVPADGLYVVVRQLEQGQAEPYHEVVSYGRMELFCHLVRIISHGGRYLQRRREHYRRLQRIWGISGLVMC